MYKTIEELMGAIYNQSIEEIRQRQMEFANEEKRLWREMMLKENEDMSNTKTFQEVIRDIKEGEVWESVDITNRMETISLSNGGSFKFEYRENIKLDNKWCLGIESKAEFRLRRKKYTFAEAFVAYEQGKEIESCWSDEKYKKTVCYADKVLDCFWNGDRYVINEDGFDLDEIRGAWHINE